VKQAVANDGPRMKRIRPAPMGRAYRYQRRLTHIVLSVAEREGPADLVTKVEEPAPESAKSGKAKKVAPATAKAKEAAAKAAKGRAKETKPAAKKAAATKKKSGK